MSNSKKTVQSTLNSSFQSARKETIKPLTRSATSSQSGDLTVTNEEVSCVELIQRDLLEIKTGINLLVTREELGGLVSDIVSQLFEKLKVKLMKEVDRQIVNKTKELEEKIESMNFENNQLREELVDSKKESEKLKEEMKNNTDCSKEAMKIANHNEQYSRKNNIKIFNLPESQNENVRAKFAEMVKNVTGHDVDERYSRNTSDPWEEWCP
jgi:hypothetical protein